MAKGSNGSKGSFLSAEFDCFPTNFFCKIIEFVGYFWIMNTKMCVAKFLLTVQCILSRDPSTLSWTPSARWRTAVPRSCKKKRSMTTRRRSRRRRRWQRRWTSDVDVGGESTTRRSRPSLTAATRDSTGRSWPTRWPLTFPELGFKQTRRSTSAISGTWQLGYRTLVVWAQVLALKMLRC